MEVVTLWFDTFGAVGRVVMVVSLRSVKMAVSEGDEGCHGISLDPTSRICSARGCTSAVIVPRSC